MRSWKVPAAIQTRAVLEWCLDIKDVDRLLVANRLNYLVMKKHKRREFLDPKAVRRAELLFQGRILRQAWVRNWPGTVSKRIEGLIFVVKFDAELLEEMVEIQPEFFKWLGSGRVPLPEDLCLYRAGNPWPSLVSVTHERDAWLISSEKPSLAGVEESPFKPEDLYIPQGTLDFIA